MLAGGAAASAEGAIGPGPDLSAAFGDLLTALTAQAEEAADGEAALQTSQADSRKSGPNWLLAMLLHRPVVAGDALPAGKTGQAAAEQTAVSAAQVVPLGNGPKSAETASPMAGSQSGAAAIPEAAANQALTNAVKQLAANQPELSGAAESPANAHGQETQNSPQATVAAGIATHPAGQAESQPEARVDEIMPAVRTEPTSSADSTVTNTPVEAVGMLPTDSAEHDSVVVTVAQAPGSSPKAESSPSVSPGQSDGEPTARQPEVIQGQPLVKGNQGNAMEATDSSAQPVEIVSAAGDRMQPAGETAFSAQADQIAAAGAAVPALATGQEQLNGQQMPTTVLDVGRMARRAQVAQQPNTVPQIMAAAHSDSAAGAVPADSTMADRSGTTSLWFERSRLLRGLWGGAESQGTANDQASAANLSEAQWSELTSNQTTLPETAAAILSGKDESDAATTGRLMRFAARETSRQPSREALGNDLQNTQAAFIGAWDRSSAQSDAGPPPELILHADANGGDPAEQLREAMQTGVRGLSVSRHPEQGLVVRLQLYPKELGEVKVELQLGSHGLVARFEAARPEAVQAIRQNLPELRNALDGQGWSQISLGADSLGGGFTQTPNERRFNRTPWQSGRGTDVSGDDGFTTAEGRPEAYRPVSTSRLDYRM
jgi:hypothetical protein